MLAESAPESRLSERPSWAISSRPFSCALTVKSPSAIASADAFIVLSGPVSLREAKYEGKIINTTESSIAAASAQMSERSVAVSSCMGLTRNAAPMTLPNALTIGAPAITPAPLVTISARTLSPESARERCFSINCMLRCLSPCSEEPIRSPVAL